MVRQYQVTRNLETRTYICHSCDDRTFPTDARLLDQCRSSPLHLNERCERYEWLFVNSQAYKYHIHASSAHFICSICNRDFHDRHELSVHSFHRHAYCHECQTTTRDFSYTVHRINEHNRCEDCHSEFPNRNELIRVSSTFFVEVKTDLS